MEWPRTRPEHARPDPAGADRRPRNLTRRGWLVGSLVAGWGLTGAGRHRHDAKEVEIEALARKAGLPPFRSSRTEHYLGIGDAPDRYREQALADRQGVGDRLPEAFPRQGFRRHVARAPADGRDPREPGLLRGVPGEDPGPVVGGHYDLDTNRLVIFDFRPDAANLAADPERVNTLTLIHEATHQLTFNTGLLNRLGDVPLCLSEGLAMYWRSLAPRRPPAAGGDQPPRLRALARPATRPRPGFPWTDCSPTTSRSAPRRRSSRPTRRVGSWVHALLTESREPPRLPRLPRRPPGPPRSRAPPRRRHDPPRESRPPRPHVAAIGQYA